MTPDYNPHVVEPGGRVEPGQWDWRGWVAAAVIAVVCTVLTVAACAQPAPLAGQARESALVVTGPTVDKAKTLRDLAGLRTQPRRRAPGYERARFGRAWTDKTTAPDAGNGCATNVDVLYRQLVDQQSERVGRCDHLVRSGLLTDPYTGRDVYYKRGARPVTVDVDHVYPLALAWDMGASQWTQQERERFANDTSVNLLAVSASMNRAKGDKTPAEWMPANRAGACAYSVRFVQVAKAYRLPITPADKTSLKTTIQGACK